LESISRRDFLRIAGGITFLSLVPVGDGLFAAPAGNAMPLFTVIPYIQPGPASKLVDGQESIVVAWQTEYAPAQFEVRYGFDQMLIHSAPVVVGQRGLETAADAQNPKQAQEIADNAIIDKRYNYSAQLTGLKLGERYNYEVIANGQVIAKGYATSRKPRHTPIRFAAFGDNSFGDLSDRAIAYYAYKSNPDFIMNTGDNVYENGLDNEYARYFFPVYNSDVADLHAGAPLLRSVPFYTVIANHDAPTKAADGSNEANFDLYRDSLAYYTSMYLPLNGPATLKSPTPIVGSDAPLVDEFKQCAGPRFPGMANYSFDYGDVHFLCIDSNQYVDPTDSALQSWIEADLSGTDAIWKFVVCHHPAFNVGAEHYAEQHMRVLCPIFEKHGVDIVLHGHEHTYQRTQPIKFVPTDMSRASVTNSKNRLVPGKFTVDYAYDGVSNTKPDGIIYLTTGAGGKNLYEPDFTDSPTRWLHPEDNNVPYLNKFYSEQHSLTLFEIHGQTLKWTQQNESGEIIDEATITKA
jgi:acid phosphatase type 7